jgi:hypothetical protein
MNKHLWEINNNFIFECTNIQKIDSWDNFIKNESWKCNILYGCKIIFFSWICREDDKYSDTEKCLKILKNDINKCK